MRRIVGLVLVVALACGTARAQKKDREPVVRGKAVSAWIKGLQSKEAVERLQAINALRDAGPEARKGVPALIDVFRDDKASFLHPLAAVALARVGPDAVPELTKGLGDKNEHVSGGCALALGLMGAQAKGAAEALGKTLEGKSEVLRFAAAQALGRIGPAAKPGAPALRKALADDDASIRVEAAASLWRVAADSKGLDVLVKAVGEEGTVGQAAIAALGEMGTEAKSAADALKKAAQKDKNPARRVEAAEAWFRVSGDADAVKVATEALKDKDVRLRAIAALGTMGANEKAVEALVGLLDDKDAAVRREAACALCERGAKVDDAAGKALVARLADPDLSVRWWAALALLCSETALRRNEEDLLRAMRIPFRRVGDPWAAIQETTAPAGQRATTALVHVLAQRPIRYRIEAARTLALLGGDAKAARPALVAALKGEKSLRRVAAEALGQLGPEGLPELIGLLSNSDDKVREGAARALGQMGVPARQAVKRLTSLLKDDESAVRAQAALALWYVDQDATDALRGLELVIKNVDHKDRWEAVEGIGVIAVEARPIIKGLLEILLTAAKDRDPAVKVQGIRWLYRRSGKARETVTLLRDLVSEKDDVVKLTAIDALGETGAEGKPVELLTAALEDRDVSARLAAEEALSRGGADMVPDLIEALKSKKPRVRAGVARALGLMGPDAKEAAKALGALRDDKDAAVKAAVMDALRAIAGGKEEELQNLDEIEREEAKKAKKD